MCWGYHRRGWVAPFERLNHEFDFHYLFHLNEQDEESSYTSQPRHYWDEFQTAQEILDRLEPDRIVFMSLAGLRSISLNMTARRRGIPTFILQHGYFHSLENYLSLPATAAQKDPKKENAVPGRSAQRAVAFMLRSNFAAEPLESSLAIAMLLVSRKIGAYRSQSWFRFCGRMPDWYVTYSMETSKFHRQLDGAVSSSIVPVGIPEFDPIFRLLASSEQPDGGGVLLIDSPNAENRYGVITTTPGRKRGFSPSFRGASRLEAAG